MRDAIVVLNAGSSSLKFSVFCTGEETASVRGQVERLEGDAQFRAEDASGKTVGEHSWASERPPGHEGATAFVLSWLHEHAANVQLAAAGHRVVHGGVAFTGPVRLNAEVLAALEGLTPLAPLHQPHSLAAISAISRAAPGLPQVACFDTAFHRTMPGVEQMYAIPPRFFEAGVRRYGFHGLSYEYIAAVMPEIDARAAAGRTIVAHLGNGASLCAMRGGRSVGTTMGFTAMDGLVMGTRCGAIDPGVVLHLAKEPGATLEGVERMLYEQSGLLGVSGISSDMRALLASTESGARRAVDMFVRRAAREIGAMAAVVGGIDALVFTGGIGEHAAEVRRAIGAACEWLGVEMDDVANASGTQRVSSAGSRVAAWVIPTNEELMILRHTRRVLGLDAVIA